SVCVSSGNRKFWPAAVAVSAVSSPLELITYTDRMLAKKVEYLGCIERKAMGRTFCRLNKAQTDCRELTTRGSISDRRAAWSGPIDDLVYIGKTRFVEPVLVQTVRGRHRPGWAENAVIA